MKMHKSMHGHTHTHERKPIRARSWHDTENRLLPLNVDAATCVTVTKTKKNSRTSKLSMVIIRTLTGAMNLRYRTQVVHNTINPTLDEQFKQRLTSSTQRSRRMTQFRQEIMYVSNIVTCRPIRMRRFFI